MLHAASFLFAGQNHRRTRFWAAMFVSQEKLLNHPEAADERDGRRWLGRRKSGSINKPRNFKCFIDARLDRAYIFY